ncbi:hypothetical protein PAECIP111802_01197 [Paenibacillus allorhizosphaerae]|uniref:Uncharacterized protein n=1 Tax=Paenibacillus allorhizosphaerae TaxID=2849866 RepID=A0ABM8VD15_9BACL|nr:hypothetical protein PAECIP111802_01197 [Paenibacillus allorhizosphaerae]
MEILYRRLLLWFNGNSVLKKGEFCNVKNLSVQMARVCQPTRLRPESDLAEWGI